MAVNNHVMILILSFGLLFEITVFPWHIHFYRTGVSLSSTAAFCRIWAFADCLFNASIGILVAWGSIERHILIFHSKWVANSKQRFFLHYLPLGIIPMCPVMFYAIVFLILPCDAPLDYSAPLCDRYTCIVSIPAVALYDNIAHYLLPVFAIVIFSLGLLVRVLWHKYRSRGRIEWRNYRKMAVQLLSIAAIYFVFVFPTACLIVAYQIGVFSDLGSDYFLIPAYFSYYTVFLTPFVCVVSLPELRSKCRQLVCLRRRNEIHPVSTTFTRRDGPRIMAATIIQR